MLLIISLDSVGQRIDNFLFTRLKGVPKTRVYRMIRKGEVRVNSKRISASFRLEEGQKIRIPPVRMAHKEVDLLEEKNNSDDIVCIEKKIKIIDEKNGLIVIDKPEGFAVHGGSGASIGIIEGLRKIKNQPNLQLVHRLDKDTSGLLLVSSKRMALLNLHRQLREGNVKKTYIACSQGRIEYGSQLTVEKPLLRFYNENGERMVKIDQKGQHSITRIRSLGSYDHKKYGWISLIQCQPLTGRTHQIRVHLQSLELPIFGDKKYGNFDQRIKYDFKRMYLHAWKLRFCELGSDLQLNYVAEIPNAFIKTFSEFKFFK